MTGLTVRGCRHDHAGALAYVLDRRISGHDSFRPADLLVEGSPGHRTLTRVRVLTLDDLTLVCPLPDQPALPREWEGVLVLPDTPRATDLPADLAASLAAVGITPDQIEEAQRRYLAGFVAEARPGPTRDARVAVAVSAVRRDLAD
ncbi:hypothetical protein [Actinopolymorpha pittospori]